MGYLKKLYLQIIKKIFPFTFFVTYEQLKKIKTNIYYLSVEDNDYIKGYSFFKTYRIMRKMKINSIYCNYFLYFKKNLVHKIFLILNAISCFIILFFAQFRIIDVRFVNLYDKRIDEQISKYLEENNDYSLSELASILKSKYLEYAYIGLSKNYSILYVELIVFNKNKVISQSNLKSDLIAMKDGLICSAIVKKGINLVTPGQTVKQGETLISGNLNYHDILKEANLCDSDGIILAHTYSYEAITISKINKIVNLTSNFKKKLYFKFLWNKKLNIMDNYFEDQVITIVETFNFFKIISILNVRYYEKKEIEVMYSFDDALEFAESKIYYALELKRVDNAESIKSIVLLDNMDNEEEYFFYFLVERIENIGVKRYYL